MIFHKYKTNLNILSVVQTYYIKSVIKQLHQLYTNTLLLITSINTKYYFTCRTYNMIFSTKLNGKNEVIRETFSIKHDIF